MALSFLSFNISARLTQTDTEGTQRLCIETRSIKSFLALGSIQPEIIKVLRTNKKQEVQHSLRLGETLQQQIN